MSDLIYVGQPNNWLPKFARVTNCGPSLDGATLQPSTYYTNVGVKVDETYTYVAVVANYQLVSVAEFDRWREQQAIERLAAAAAEIQEDLLVEVRLLGEFEVVLRPREGTDGEA